MMVLLQGKIPETIVDMGAGSAFFSRYLLEHSGAREAWCLDPAYPSECDEVIGPKVLHYRRGMDRLEGDLVLLMDVLEHVDDDLAFLRSLAGGAKRGTRFFITVPAFPRLWSGHDVFLGHRRRYTLSGLRRVVKDAGLEEKKAGYYFAAVLPMAAAARWGRKIAGRDTARSQLGEVPPILNGLFKALCLLELKVIEGNDLAGLTVYCFADKP